MTTPATGNSTIGAATTSPRITEVVSFTAPNGGVYGATAIDGTVQVAGYQLTAGGPDGLVGGVRVSAASDGLVHAGSVASYVEVTAASTQQATSTNDSGSTQTSSSSEAESTESATATDSESSTAASGSASDTAQSTGGAAGGAVAKSKSAMTGLAGIAGLLCLFG